MNFETSYGSGVTTLHMKVKTTSNKYVGEFCRSDDGLGPNPRLNVEHLMPMQAGCGKGEAMIA